MTLLQRNGSSEGRAGVPEDAKAMVEVARVEGIPTVWDRLAAQEPHCGYCSLGVSCRNCSMGPCRIDPFGNGPQVGVCGADADLIVARNLSRAIAVGSASHSDHGRDILEVFEQTAKGETSGYRIADEPKLRALAAEWGIETADRPINEIGVDLADAMFEDFGSRKQRWASSPGCPRRAGRSGSGSRSRPAASTARTSRCSTGPTWASTPTTPTCSSTASGRACPTAGAAR